MIRFGGFMVKVNDEPFDFFKVPVWVDPAKSDKSGKSRSRSSSKSSLSSESSADTEQQRAINQVGSEALIQSVQHQEETNKKRRRSTSESTTSSPPPPPKMSVRRETDEGS